ncbi:MAG: response regulator [Gammaproteobacteria bacterium]|nr:response regulator [Gammaproteobacteria bacterium]
MDPANGSSSMVDVVPQESPFPYVASQLGITLAVVALLLLVITLIIHLRYRRQADSKLRSLLESMGRLEQASEPRDRAVTSGDEQERLMDKLGQIMKGFRREATASSDSDKKLTALFNVVQEGIVITNSEGVIENVNPSLCKMFGYEESELLGQSNKKLMPVPYAEHHDAYMQESVRTGNMGYMGRYRDLLAMRKDGSTFPMVINIDRIEVGQQFKFAAIIRDVSQQKEYEQQLLKAKMRAEVANEAKSSFLSMMSHEIRTPLNGVMGMLQMLRPEISNPEHKEFIEVASNSATNLLHIVDDILNYSKAESGVMRLEQQDFSLRDLLEESVDLYMARLADKQLRLKFYVPQTMPVLLCGDPFRIQQMVNNLISNAIKFTDEGEIRLAADWVEKFDDDIDVTIIVSDTGVGISEDKFTDIFEPFVQADNSVTRSFGGTGLGLSIVKRIAELMGGGVSLESRKGQGSTFRLNLPLKICTTDEAKKHVDLKGKRILYAVKDNPDEMLLDYMLHNGAQVEQIQLADMTHRSAPDELTHDAIIVECGDNDSLQLADKLATELSGRTRIICLREHLQPLPLEISETVWVLHEPLMSRTLDSVFTSLLDEPHKESTMADQKEGTGMSRILLVEDNPVNQMVAKAMLIKMGYEPVVANNGQEALDLVKSETVDLVLMDCHMPVMDGYEATAKMREYLSGKPLPIIAMTADASQSDRERCLGVGMDDHIPKPIKMDLLQSAIHQWLNNAS